MFVYGTLKRGESNHHWLAGAQFLGRRRLAGAELHDLGPYPMAVPAAARTLPEAGDAGAGEQEAPLPVIHGELFAVEPQHLAQLDLLEDAPREYDRHWLRLSDQTAAWVYLGRHAQVNGAPLVPFADWGTTPVFSYGSNLWPEQLAARCPDWDGSGLVARLEGWRWSICKLRQPRRQTDPAHGAAGIQPEPGRHCWGVVQHLSRADRRELDVSEGVASGHYRPQSVMVTTPEGERFEASTYVPTPGWTAEGLQPSADYASRLRRGLAHWPFPAAWPLELEALLAPEPRGH